MAFKYFARRKGRSENRKCKQAERTGGANNSNGGVSNFSE